MDTFTGRFSTYGDIDKCLTGAKQYKETFKGAHGNEDPVTGYQKHYLTLLGVDIPAGTSRKEGFRMLNNATGGIKLYTMRGFVEDFNV